MSKGSISKKKIRRLKKRHKENEKEEDLASERAKTF
jgi:hypothetical protein